MRMPEISALQFASRLLSGHQYSEGFVYLLEKLIGAASTTVGAILTKSSKYW